MFYATILDRESFEPVPTQAQLTLRPVRWAARAVGGFHDATIEVVAQDVGLWEIARWLRCGIEIRNQNDSVVWCGFVHDISISVGGVQVELSLDSMANRIQVLYTYEDVSGTNVSGSTAWAEDSGSVDKYGTKELRHSASDTTPTAAATLRDLILETRKAAVPTFDLGATETRGELNCLGWYHTLDWQYYTNVLGREEAADANGYQALGLGFTSTEVAFTKARVIAAHDVGGRFEYFDAGQKVTISGSTSNNGTFEIKAADNKEGKTYTSTTLSCEPRDDIFDDTGKALNFIDTDDMILCSGFPTAANNRDYLVERSGDDAIEVHNTYGEVSAVDAAGSSVTIKRGNKIELLGTMTNEQLGDTVTVTQHGVKIAQYVTNTTGGAWTIDKVGIQVAHIGDPADDITVALHTNDGGVPSASAVASGTIDAGDVTDRTQWLWADFGNTYTFATGTGYWIVISRGGSNDWDDFYRVGIHEDDAHTQAYFLLWDGSSWVYRPKNAKLAYSIWGAQDTTAQVASIVGSAGEFFTTCSVAATAGVETNQYRDGKNTARDEIDDLLATGDSAGGRMVARVTPDRVLIVDAAPAATDEYMMIYRQDGTLALPYGGALESGRLVAGQWLTIEGIPTSVDALASLATIFIEDDEYTVSNGGNRPRPAGARDPWDVTTQQG